MPTYKVAPGKGTATGWTLAGKTYLSGSEVELPDKIGEIGVAKGIFSVMEMPIPEKNTPVEFPGRSVLTEEEIQKSKESTEWLMAPAGTPIKRRGRKPKGQQLDEEVE